MRYDPIARLLLTPVDQEAPDRVQRLRRLGLGERSEPAFDAFAQQLAQMTGAPYAMVNFIDENRQFFAGLHTTRGTEGERGTGGERFMARDHGYCPYVVVRRKALVLEDVRDFPASRATPWSTRSGSAPTSAPRSSTVRAWPSARSVWSTPSPGAGGARVSTPSSRSRRS